MVEKTIFLVKYIFPPQFHILLQFGSIKIFINNHVLKYPFEEWKPILDKKYILWGMTFYQINQNVLDFKPFFNIPNGF